LENNSFRNCFIFVQTSKKVIVREIEIDRERERERGQIFLDLESGYILSGSYIQHLSFPHFVFSLSSFFFCFCFFFSLFSFLRIYTHTHVSLPPPPPTPFIFISNMSTTNTTDGGVKKSPAKTQSNLKELDDVSQSQTKSQTKAQTSIARDAMDIALCMAGVYGCYLYYGILQERM
jgi:hypothetical protein